MIEESVNSFNLEIIRRYSQIIDDQANYIKELKQVNKMYSSYGEKLAAEMASHDKTKGKLDRASHLICELKKENEVLCIEFFLGLKEWE